MAHKSIGERFVEGKAYAAWKAGGRGTDELDDVDVKTLMQTTAGYAPESVRNGRIEPETGGQRPLMVVDLPMATETGQNTVKYMAETAFAAEATETAEGGAYPEGELALTEQDSPIEKIAVFLPVTEEQLEDEPRARDYVNNRLARMIRQRLDGQILSGDGTPPNLGGILANGSIQSQALGGGTHLDTVLIGIQKVRHTGFAEPDAIVLHPNDWVTMRSVKASTGGPYLWGNPGGSGDGGREMLYGVPVYVTAAITEGTGLVGAFRDFSELAFRRGLTISVADDHDELFTQGVLAIRADVRVAVVVYRPTAFCKLTGI